MTKRRGVINLKRAYDPPDNADGVRFLVERLWPRGIKKVDLPLDGWLKEAAPSTTLRKWFSHDPAKWAEFQRHYFAELDANPDSWAPIPEAARRSPVTLIFSSHDPSHNNALALKEYLDKKLNLSA
jgi:uncharacterized protein YeaO (DUF488 family)